MDEYTNRFHELSIRSQVSEIERQSIARYKTGLQKDIRRELLTVRLKELMRLIKLPSASNNRIEAQQGDVQIQGGATLLPEAHNIPLVGLLSTGTYLQLGT